MQLHGLTFLTRYINRIYLFHCTYLLKSKFEISYSCSAAFKLYLVAAVTYKKNIKNSFPFPH